MHDRRRRLLVALATVAALILCGCANAAAFPSAGSIFGATMSARLAVAAPGVGHAYDPPSSSTTPTTNGEGGAAGATTDSARGSRGEAVALRLVVATEDVPTVVFSRSRAPGIADNFDNAVANGAPTRLDRVGAAARDANRRAALRGQSPAPAGQSLDEYPFACSAQGGCGSFVSPVPAAEQSYQGGVLSQFFQRQGVNPGDPFNVKFGP